MLPSPIIEGVLPAFYLDDDGIAVIRIPYSMSRAVNRNEVSGFKLKIKNIQGGDYIGLPRTSTTEDNDGVKFYFTQQELVDEKYIIGSFYKAQLAYVDSKGETGYYSTVGIIKYTTKPEISIVNLAPSSNNPHQYEYTGLYRQLGTNKDATEKVYSYRFELKEQSGKVIEDTGYLIHNNTNDTDYYESKDTFLISRDLEDNKKYILTYYVKTNNGLEVSSPRYKIVMKKAVHSVLGNSKLTATLNYNNGYVALKLEGEHNELDVEIPVKGTFILSRSSESDDYKEWKEIDKFVLAYEKPSLKTWKDFTIEQGVNYKYSIQQYNSQNLFSDRTVSNIIYADFEDSFLFDGKRQLKIKFNPKVTSFKKDILESKVDTIGSKYPFIFRNGSVEYKEFPISGLISYLSDDEGLFYPEAQDLFFNQERHEERRYKSVKEYPGSVYEQRGFPKTDDYKREMAYKKDYLFYYFKEKDGSYVRWSQSDKIDSKHPIDSWRFQEPYFKAIEDNLYFDTRYSVDKFDKNTKLKTTNEVSYNLYTEREFKLYVLDWLTNGEPKLFKSPNEGNCLVRLMNTSLSPNDQLGRMLHTFNCTAYEVADISYNSLVNYGIIDIPETSTRQFLKIASLPMVTDESIYPSKYAFYQSDGNYWYAKGQVLPMHAEWADITDMAPGTLVTIVIDGKNEEIMIGATGSYSIPVPVEQISIANGAESGGIITYGYMGTLNDSFSQILDTNIKEIIGKQFIGAYDNVLSTLENVAKKVVNYYDIKIYKRPEIELYSDEEGNLFSAEGLLVGKFTEGDHIDLTYIQGYNPLCVYKYTTKNSNFMGPAYHEVLFNQTEYGDANRTPPEDIFDDNAMFEYEKIRSDENRTVSNPYLMDVRDYPLFVTSGTLYYKTAEGLIDLCTDMELDTGKTYYIQDDIEFFYDPTDLRRVYISDKTYQTYLRMPGMNQEELDSTFTVYRNFAYINSQNINVTETGYYHTGPIDQSEIHSLETRTGVYCELFYQEQIIEYDIDASVKGYKDVVDEYEEKLSKEYMVQKCQEGKAEEYIDEIDCIVEGFYRAKDVTEDYYYPNRLFIRMPNGFQRQTEDDPFDPNKTYYYASDSITYETAYKNYITVLEQYLKRIEEEG